MGCEPKELNFNVQCELTYEKFEQGVLTQTGKTTQDFYSPKTAKQLEEELSGKARIFEKYELKTTAKCK